MNKLKKPMTRLIMLMALSIAMISGGCKKDDPAPPAPARTVTYNLMVKDVLGVSGTAMFTEVSSTLTTIDIELINAPSGIHPAELCMNSVVESGPVIITLNPVDESGKSSTSVTAMTYSLLIGYDGFIKVLNSITEPNIILAQGDIGGNVITETNITYNLDTVGVYGVSGTALFEQRENRSTLVTITLTGTIAGDTYPASINLGSIASIGGGPVVKVLNDVDGDNGKSYTNIRELESGVIIIYNNWLVYDGYINIYETSIGFGNIISHGNIGSN